MAKKKWFVDPDSAQVSLGDGEWIELKKRLTVGEERDAMKALYRMVDGVLSPDMAMIGIADVMAYLVDWSLTRNGKRVDIGTDGKKLAALRSLSQDAFKAIHEAVTKHIEVMTAERDAEKNDQDGESESSATLPSVDACVGPSTN